VAVVEPLEMPYLAVEADHGCHIGIQRVPIRTRQLGKWCDWRVGVLSMPDLTSNYIPGPKKICEVEYLERRRKVGLSVKGLYLVRMPEPLFLRIQSLLHIL
jgi:hypothetical protein